MNKIPINSPTQDSKIKYLQIIRDKEEIIINLQTLNQQLLNELQHTKQQNTECINQSKNTKIESTNKQLKNMLTETQNFVLQYQNDLEQYQSIVQQILEITNFYKLNKQTSITSILQFLSEEVFNLQIIDLWNKIKHILKILLDQIPQKIEIPHLIECNELQYHPYSTQSMLVELIQMINTKAINPIEKQINYASQFQNQVNRINLYETSFVLINTDEQQLKKKINQQQEHIIELEEEIQKLQINIKQLQEQQVMQTMKSSERKPFVEILSIKDVSSSSEDENEEIIKLSNELDKKDLQISKLQQNIQNLQYKIDHTLLEQQFWDLIVNCQDDSLHQLIDQGWTLNFKHQYGLSSHQVIYSFLGMDSSFLQFSLENQFLNDFHFEKLADQTYLQIANNQLIYLKSLIIEGQNVLIQSKVLKQPSNNFYQINETSEGTQALNEFLIQFSLSQGILFLCLKNLDEGNLKILQLAIKIQNSISTFSTLIVLLDEEFIDQDTLSNLIQEYNFLSVDDEIQNDQNQIRFLFSSGDNFDFNKIKDKIINQKKNDYVKQLTQFITQNAQYYFTKFEQCKLDFVQAIHNENIFEMKLIQLPDQDSIKLNYNRQQQIIREEQLQIQKISDSQYHIFFNEKIQETRLKSYSIKDEGVIVRLKCTFDNENMTSKQYILKTTYNIDENQEVSHTIIDDKLILQL